MYSRSRPRRSTRPSRSSTTRSARSASYSRSRRPLSSLSAYAQALTAASIETKNFDMPVATGPFTGTSAQPTLIGTISLHNSIVEIPQGTTANTREGREIIVTGIEVLGTISLGQGAAAADAAAVIRMMLILDKQCNLGTKVTASCTAGTGAGTNFTEAGTTTGVFAIGMHITGAGILNGTIIVSGTSPNWVVSTTMPAGPIVVTGVQDTSDILQLVNAAGTVDNTNVNSFLNVYNAQRFRVLEDKIITLNPTTVDSITAPTKTDVTQQHISMKLSCAIPIVYNGTSGLLATINSNNIFLLCIGYGSQTALDAIAMRVGSRVLYVG